MLNPNLAFILFSEQWITDLSALNYSGRKKCSNAFVHITLFYPDQPYPILSEITQPESDLPVVDRTPHILSCHMLSVIKRHF